MAKEGGARGTARAPVGWWRQVGTLVRRELRQLRRDRLALSIAIVAPIAAAMIAAVALGAPQQVDATIAIVTPPGTGDATELAVAAFADEDFGLRVVATEAEARDLVTRGEVSGAVVWPASPEEPARVIANRSEQIPEAIAHDLALLGRVPGVANTASPEALEAEPPVVTEHVDHVLNGAELYGPVIAIFFLFLTSGLIARSLQVERASGTLARIRVIGTRRDAILAGKGIVMLILSALEIGSVLLALQLVFGASWGSVGATIAVTSAIILAVGAIALAIAVVARSIEEAQGLELVIALVLLALGGNVVPLPNLPAAARVIARVTPNGVAVAAFREVSVGGGLGDVWRPVAVLVAFALALGSFAFRRAQRIVVR